MARRAIVSGQFYPDQSEDLNQQIEDFKCNQSSRILAKGIIIPHAGYTYSGRVAAATVAKILPKKRIVILGPNHTGLGPNFSLWSNGAWEIPTGNITIDQELNTAILSKGTLIVEDTSAHKNEHSIEVQLPILKYFFNDFKFVALACKQDNLQIYRQVADQIFEAVKSDKENVLFVASTDLTHYEPDQVARTKDRAIIESLVNLDEQDLLKKVKKHAVSMCGVAPVAIMLACLKKIGVKKSQVALYQTSGDASGDFTSVVGYVGMIIN